MHELYKAARKGDLATAIKLLIANHANVNGDGDGKVPLLAAAAKGHLTMLNLLIAFGADVHAVDLKGWCAVHKAAQKGQSLCLMALSDAGADMQTKTPEGLTPLRLAAIEHQSATIPFLVEDSSGMTDIDVKCNRGWTPLHYACNHFIYERHEPLGPAVPVLLSYGADVLAVDVAGQRPLHVAIAAYEHFDYNTIGGVYKHGYSCIAVLIAEGDRDWSIIPKECDLIDLALYHVWNDAPDEIHEVISRLPYPDLKTDFYHLQHAAMVDIMQTILLSINRHFCGDDLAIVRENIFEKIFGRN